MDQNGSEWIRMDQNGSEWIRMDQNGSEWIRMDQIELQVPSPEQLANYVKQVFLSGDGSDSSAATNFPWACRCNVMAQAIWLKSAPVAPGSG